MPNTAYTFFFVAFRPDPGHDLPLRGFAITLTGHTTIGKTPLADYHPEEETCT
jgi:hypothetical protein